MEKVLNLYGGIGGNRKHWKGVKVTTVELNPKIAQAYKSLFLEDTVIVGDAHEYLLKHYQEFDTIWSSPPCQTHSRMVKFTRHKKRPYPDLTMYQEILFLQNHFRGLWVVENVIPYYTPLIPPSKKIGRHLFWSNAELSDCEDIKPPGFMNLGTVKDSKQLKNWLGLNYEGNIYYKGNHDPCQVLRNCVHPKIGLSIFNDLI